MSSLGAWTCRQRRLAATRLGVAAVVQDSLFTRAACMRARICWSFFFDIVALCCSALLG